MKRPTLTTLYLYGILLVLFGVALHAPITVYFGSLLPDAAQPIKAWKEILMTGLGLIAIVMVTTHGVWRRLLNDWAVRLSLVYIVLHIVLALLAPEDLRSQVAGLMIDLRFVAFFLLAYVLVMLRPEAWRWLLGTAAVAAAVVLGFGLLQITVLPDDVLAGIGYGDDTVRPFTTIDRNPEFVRINSTLRGPNPLGAIVTLYVAIGLAYLASRWRGLSERRRAMMIASLLVALAVLFASYSRSAYVAVVVAGLVVGLAHIRRRPSRRAIAVSAGFVLGGLMAFTFLQSTDWYSNVILHEDPESTVISKSNDEHVSSLADGTRRLISQPLGAGVGSTGSASLYDEDTKNDAIIENWYLLVAHESGWLGLALFGALFGLILIRLWGHRTGWPALGLFASGVGLALIGLLLPVWADETVALTWWGLAGGILGSGYAKRTRQ